MSHTIATLWFASFLFGSIPFGLLIAKVFHGKNIREHGSGNIGATNVSRVLGFWPAGFLTFILDVAKGAAAILIAHPIMIHFLSRTFHLEDLDPSRFVVWSCGFFAVVGHCFSPWLKMKGGKGVATGFGVILALSPFAALGGLVGFLIAFLQYRTGSLASLVGLVCASVVHLVLSSYGPELFAGGALIAVILYRHHDNIEALLEGRERVFR